MTKAEVVGLAASRESYLPKSDKTGRFSDGVKYCFGNPIDAFDTILEVLLLSSFKET